MKSGIEVRIGQRSNPYLVGIDVGFGELKRISNVFPQPVSIPSAVIPGAKPSSGKLFELHTIEDDVLIVSTEEGTFFVGNKAMHIPTSGSKRTQVRNRAKDLSSRVLFQTGIGLSVPHQNGEYDVHVVTGLPNDDYDLSIKEDLFHFLNKSFTITFHLSETKSIEKKINIVGLDILRQPEGAVTHNQFTFDEEVFIKPSNKAKEMVGIIDFGHFTTDYALFQEGVIIENDSMNGSTVGLTEVYNKLKRKLIIKFDSMGYEYRATDKDLDEAIRTGYVSYMGSKHDVKEEVKESTQESVRTIAKAVLDDWGNETNRLDLIVISGGGSHLFQEYLKDEFSLRGKQDFYIMESPQFSNVLGFYMYGCIVLSSLYSSEAVYQKYVNKVFGET